MFTDLAGFTPMVEEGDPQVVIPLLNEYLDEMTRIESPAVKAYVAAFDKLESGDPTANQAFASVIRQFGNDPLSTFHLRRILAGEAGALISLVTK